MNTPILLALAIVAGLALLVTHDRQQAEREMAPIMWIQSVETMLPPPPPKRHEWNRRDRA